MVAVTALVASVTHFLEFARTPDAPTGEILAIVAFTIQGVIIGGQLGAWVASRVSQHALERTMGILFLLVGVLILGEVIL